jgi:hypothetical protein
VGRTTHHVVSGCSVVVQIGYSTDVQFPTVAGVVSTLSKYKALPVSNNEGNYTCSLWHKSELNNSHYLGTQNKYKKACTLQRKGTDVYVCTGLSTPVSSVFDIARL